MKDIRVLLVGSSGRMGQEILLLSKEHPMIQIDLGVARRKAAQDFLQLASIGDVDVKQVDVVVDFSLPTVFNEVVRWCVKNKKPLVSGTTGLSPNQIEAAKKAGKKTAVFWSPNMSLGVAVFNELLKHFGQLEGFDFQIEEAHHRRKKDRPSGTAILLQKNLEDVLQKKLPEILSIRGGGVFGIHKLLAMSEEETLSIEHTALNRRVFARGALTAATWIYKRKAGFYQMHDVLR